MLNFETGKAADTAQCYKLTENRHQRKAKKVRTKAASIAHRQARLFPTVRQQTPEGWADVLELSDPCRVSKGKNPSFSFTV